MNKYIVSFICFSLHLMALDHRSFCQPKMICCKLFNHCTYPNGLYAGANLFGLSLNSSFKGAEVSGTCFMGGVQLGYICQKPDCFYLDADLLLAIGGKFNETIDQFSIDQDDDDGYGFFHAGLSAGYPFQKKNALIAPFVSLGIYVLGSTNENRGISEDLPYAGLGLNYLYEYKRFFEYGLDLRLFYTFAGRIKMELDSITLKKGMNRPGGQIAAFFNWHFGETRRWDFRLNPYLLALTFTELQLAFGSSISLGYHF